MHEGQAQTEVEAGGAEPQGEEELEAAPLGVIEARLAGAETVAPVAASPLPRLSDRVTAKRWRAEDGTVAFVTMITEGEELTPEGCSMSPVPQWAIAPVDAEGNAQRFQLGPYGAPSEILDIDGDGQWALLVMPGMLYAEPQLLTITSEGLTALTSLTAIPSFGCPC
jgi:hypothetical protein